MQRAFPSKMAKRSADSQDVVDHKRHKSNGPVPPLFQIFHGEVASVKEYGLFVKIPGSSRQGLVHKSQISKSKVDDPSEMFARGECVYCKVISINDDGEKIGLAMKNVNQTTGRDEDPNNIELSQDEKRRKQFGKHNERQKIVLEAVLDTTCKKCGGKGHLAQDCFKMGETSYELIPDLDDYMQTMATQQQGESSSKRKKKEKKKSKKKKERKKKRRKETSSSSDYDTSASEHKHKKKKHHRRHSSSETSDSDGGSRKKKTKKKKVRKKRHYSSSSSSSS